MATSTIFRRVRFLAPAVVLLASLHMAPAHAANAENEAAARSLFEEGRALVAAGRPADACPKFEESQRLDPGIGTQFNLADCYERVGKTASAWSTFLDVASKARAAGQNDRETVARQRASALAPRLSKVVIVVPPGNDLPELEIRRGTVVVSKGAWGSAVAVDPGQHEVSARAPGRKPWTTKVDVAGEGKSITVTVPLLEAENAPGQPPAVVPPGTSAKPAPSATPAPVAPTPGPATQGSSSSLRTVGIIVGGVGVVSIIGGSIFAASAKSKQSDARGHCASYPDGCDDTGVSLNKDARSAATIANVAFIAGGLLAAGGAVLFFTAPSGKAPSTGSRIAPMVGRDGAGVTLTGAW